MSQSSSISAEIDVESVLLCNNIKELEKIVSKLERVVLEQQKVIQTKRSARAEQKAQEKTFDGVDDPLLAILKLKEKRLRKELAVVKDYPLAVDDNNGVLEVILEDTIKNSIKMSKASVNLLEKTENRLQLRLERVEYGIEQHKKICAILGAHKEEMERKLNEMNLSNTDDEAEIPQSSEKTDLEKKISRTGKRVTAYAHVLNEFLQNNFPDPPSEQIRSGRPATVKTINFKTLREMIEMLVSKYINTPHDSYVGTDETWWPPYLEGLLRYDIIVQHPQNRNLVRLENYSNE